MRGIRVAVLSWLLLPAAALAGQPAPPPPAPAHAGTTTATTSAADPHTPATDIKAGADTYPAWRDRAVAALARRGDADGYFGAAMLVHGTDRGKYVQDAVRVAPDDPDVAWMKWWKCELIPECDPAAAIADVRKLEPDNAAAWIPDVKSAMASGDPFKVTDALKKVASLGRFDDHTWSIGRRAGLATSALQPPPEPRVSPATRLLFDIANAGHPMGMGGVYGVTIACSNLLFFQARLHACKAIAGLLQHSGDRQYASIGVALAYLLLQPEVYLEPEPSSSTGAAAEAPIAPIPDVAPASGDPEVASLISRHRTFVWRTLKWVKLQLEVDEDPALAKTVQNAIRSQPDEVAMIATVLKERGIPLEPAAGWEPAGAASSGK
jgi:hypothetical protein